ncbi:Uncharacterised protein [Klebsiella michiganensis]|uniref:Uncharacterized protein n=1 Tax=Klebsiella michiganensis TaxID=1134687 RepID=A0A7H4MW32_9ENTR|nr:Uncharacterised protein [Klebsiella michiganensis]STW78662.1 Uncharacterised protein [Klebsiella michiganensis]
MTNQLTITREQLTEWVAQLDCDGGCDATDKQLAVAMINAARDITVAKINAKGAKFDGYTTSVNWFDRSMKEVREAVKAVLPDIEREVS